MTEGVCAYRGVCAACGGLFTDDEWDLRHSDDDGEDVHERCCTRPDCVWVMKQVAAREEQGAEVRDGAVGEV